MDLTPSGRIRRAEAVVREQRGDPLFGAVNVVGVNEIEDGGEYVSADEMRDAVFEIGRLQRAVMGQPDPG